jgi:orotidine-5'-phosphate decarboxylase
MGEAGGVQGFGARLAHAVGRTGPICAGIDPSRALLSEWGLSDDPDGLRQFASRCVEAFAEVVPVVKPQVAFFERHGSAGIAVHAAFIADARDAGLLVIADAKRGDIGSTVEAYASAWLDDSSPLAADAVTALPYMGLGALDPMVDLAAATGRGVIVVVRSSNPEGREIQKALTRAGSGPSVEDMLLAQIAARNEGGAPSGAGGDGGGGMPGQAAGHVGAVVGATLRPSSFPLASLGGPILSPGVGAQGATAADVADLFAGCAPGAVVANVSRSVLGAGPTVVALRKAVVSARDEMAAALGG